MDFIIRIGLKQQPARISFKRADFLYCFIKELLHHDFLHLHLIAVDEASRLRHGVEYAVEERGLEVAVLPRHRNRVRRGEVLRVEAENPVEETLEVRILAEERSVDLCAALAGNLDERVPFGVARNLVELPLVVGVSRTSMIYRFLGSSPEEALNGTTVLNTLALQKGANILRVHDVKEAVEVVRLVEKFSN